MKEVAEFVGKPELAVLLSAALPISELRGAIPLAIFGFRMVFWKAFLLGVIGNLIPILPLLYLLDPTRRLLSRTKPGRSFFNWLFERTKKRGEIVEKYESLGLLIFVATPLPMTGAWTGCVAALVFGIPQSKAFPVIVLGVIAAGVVVTVFCTLGLIGAIVAFIILLLLAGKYIWAKT